MTYGTVRREDSGILPFANFLFVEKRKDEIRNSNLRLGRGNVKHAGLGSPAADTCKPHEVPGRPCALNGTDGNFYAFSSPANEKSGFQIPTSKKFLVNSHCAVVHPLSSPLFLLLFLSSPFFSFSPSTQNDQNETSGRSLVATIGCGGCAIS